MPELITESSEIRQKLQDSMSKKGAAVFRSTVLENRFPVQYFVNPRETLAAACDLAEAALNKPYGLASMHMLSVTAETPIQLANSLGAIGAVSNINLLSKSYSQKPDEFKDIFDKYNFAVRDFQNLLQEKPNGSILGESFAGNLFEEAKQRGIGNAAQIIEEWAQKIKGINQKSHRNLLNCLVEGYFLTALDTGMGFDPLKMEISTEFLSRSNLIFLETERLIRLHPEYFEQIFGKHSTFWGNNARDKLFPDLKYIANMIFRDLFRMARAGTDFTDPKLTTTIQQLYDVTSKDISTNEALKKTAEAEKAEWKITQADFEQKWQTSTTDYEKKNGSFNTPPSPSQSIDLLTGGIDILHEGIFLNITNVQLRAGLEVIIPKFWPFKDLDFILTQVLSEYDYDPVSGDPILTISGEKALAQLIFLPDNLRPQILGSDIKINVLQKSASEKIFRRLAQVTHPDKGSDRFPNSDKANFDTVEEFYKIANGLYRYMR